MNNTNNNNTNKMNKLFLINKNKSNMESKVYKFKDIGSFGVVVYDDNNILYKILELTTNQDKNQQDIIEKNNLVEIIILNSFSENKNIIQSISTFYYDNRIDKQLGTKIGVFQSNIYLQCPWIVRETSTLIFNRLKMYKGNLYSYINNTNLNLVRNNFASIAKQLIRGINNLHQKGLLHGDIKSDNILYNFELDEFNQIVLIDFGGVKPVHIKEYFKTCTIITRSPEDLKYETNPYLEQYLSDFKSDIWSLGIVFCEILLGQNPITKLYNEYKNFNLDDEEIEMKLAKEFSKIEYLDIEKLIRQKIKYENIIDPDLCVKLIFYSKIIKKMLYTDPNKRISSLSEIYKQLFNEDLETDNPDYNYFYPNINNDNFLDFRLIYYEKVINLFCILTTNLEYALPFLVDLLDRFFSKLSIENKVETLSEIELEAIGVSMLYLTLIWYTSELFDFAHIDSKTKYLTFDIVKDYIIQILVYMDYDVFRPFMKINYKSNIKSIVMNNIENKIIGLEPELYNKDS
jgi:serine/threonine protein kinase